MNLIPSIPSKDRRGSTTVYLKKATSFSKSDNTKTLIEHQQQQKDHGTLSGKMMSHKQVLTGMSRIMMSYLQVVAVARSVPISWPQAVVDTLNAFSSVSAPSLSLVSIDCAMSPKSINAVNAVEGGNAAADSIKPIYVKFILTMFVPVMATLLPLLFWSLYYCFGNMCVKQRKCKKCCTWKEDISEDDRKWYGFTTVDQANHHDLKKNAHERFKVTLMIVFFLFYPTIIKGVLGMFSCQRFATIEYLIADMSVECWTEEHDTYVVLAAIFFVLYVVGIPVVGCIILHHFMPGIHFNPTEDITQFNPVAGRAYTRQDRGHLLKLKLEATAVYGFMWEGLQEKGLAPFWEWSVIMSRKCAIIAIILLLQNYSPQYQLTVALIVMFGYNLMHVKYHPYDLFYHDRLEFLSLISSEMTLFGGLVISFLETDKAACVTNCEKAAKSEEATSQGIGWAIIFFNVLFLCYFSIGLLFHMYFVLIPKKLRCQKIEQAASVAHDTMSKQAPVFHMTVFPNHHHKYHGEHDRDDFGSTMSTDSFDVAAVSIQIKHAKEDAKEYKEQVAAGHDEAHAKVQARLMKKNKKKKKKKNSQVEAEAKYVEVEMVAAGKTPFLLALLASSTDATTCTPGTTS